MRLCRFGDRRLGVVEGKSVFDVTSVLETLDRHSYPLPTHDLLIANLDRIREKIGAIKNTAEQIPLDRIYLHSPIANPGKLIAAPVNYQKHLDEAIAEPQTFSAAHVRTIHEMGLFLKATSSLVGPSDGVALRFPDRRNDHEIELAVIIGKTVSNLPAEQALDAIAGYTIGLDMTVRGPEERSLRKSIDSYSVLGPWLVTSDELRDPNALGFELKVNGEVRQKANTRDLVLSIAKLIEFASRFYTLHPGDVIYTGTPEGVAPVAPGDRIEASFDRIGSMLVDVRAA
jgi:2-keto-4-pentenoate hydratase/2-oxohepta-3-ene-1,7-dioic acid hydratase in catechol pathway